MGPNDVYYRIYKDRNNIPVVVEMQYFDEDDYIQSRFLDRRKFSSKEEAQKVVDEQDSRFMKKKLDHKQELLVELCFAFGWSLEHDNHGQIVFYTGLSRDEDGNLCECYR